jgi:enoyl-CoA hydratase/carnithine racemase
MHLVTTGATYSPADPLLAGLFSEVLDTPAEVLPRALQLAEEYVRNCSGVSWALMRDLMWRGPGSAEEAHLLDSRVIYEIFPSQDYKEGVKSFLEKRDPKFTGSMEKDAPQTYPWWNAIATAYRAKAKTGESKL